MSVVVLGSINADLVLTTPRLPQPGETVRASSFATYPGGKGANQAVAAARLGAKVSLIGRVGNDPAGSRILDALVSDGVAVDDVVVDQRASTGTALITVADDGQNTIVTNGGANHNAGEAELAALDKLIAKAQILLVQLELPLDVVQAAVTVAKNAGVPVVLDPAPIAVLEADMYRQISWITPNETEAHALTAIGPSVGPPAADPIDPEGAAAELRRRGVEHVAITLGESGCFYLGPSGGIHVASPSVEAIDTVACGDSFNGALAAALVAGTAIEQALRRACAAGAAAATRAGAYPSLPGREDVDRLT